MVRSTLGVRQAEAPESDIEVFTMGMHLAPDFLERSFLDQGASAA